LPYTTLFRSESGEFLLDPAGHFLNADLMDEDLDARLVLVVAPAEEVVDAQDRRAIGEQIRFREKIANPFGQERRASLAAADEDRKAEPSIGTAPQLQADVMGADGGAVVGGAGHGDLELARQKG